MNNTDWIPIVYGIIILVIAAVLLWVAWGYCKEWLRSRIVQLDKEPVSKTGEYMHGQWCFVGEDLTGRWCVKTPEEGLCPKKRVFRSRSECEMKTASASPLGINQHDTTMIPIAGLSIA